MCQGLVLTSRALIVYDDSNLQNTVTIKLDTLPLYLLWLWTAMKSVADQFDINNNMVNFYYLYLA